MCPGVFFLNSHRGQSSRCDPSIWRGNKLVWEPRTFNGIVNFRAPPKKVGDDFHSAVKALVSGAAYGRRNVYCIRPSEYEPHAMFDDEKRIVYVIARPTGDRCIFTFPQEVDTIG